jgi:putative endonuclease
MAWTVYALVSGASGHIYVGVTTDLARRLAQHNGERPGGARSTRGGRPWALGASWGPYPERGRAQVVEHAVKRLRGRERLAWRDPVDAAAEPHS